MIIDKEHLKEGGRLIARQGAMVSLKTDSIKRFSLTFKSA